MSLHEISARLLKLLKMLHILNKVEYRNIKTHIWAALTFPICCALAFHYF